MNESKIKGSYKGFEDDPTFGMNSTITDSICVGCVFSREDKEKHRAACKFYSFFEILDRVSAESCIKRKTKE